MLTAQRSGELCAAKWTDISEGIWRFPKTKAGVPQQIPITPYILSVLESLREENQLLKNRSKLANKDHYDTFLFPSRRSRTKSNKKHVHTLAKACNEIEEKVGSQFTPHDLRRTAATLMRRFGVSKDTVRKILNHSESREDSRELLGTYDRYDQQPEMLDALIRLSDGVLSIINSKSAK